MCIFQNTTKLNEILHFYELVEKFTKHYLNFIFFTSKFKIMKRFLFSLAFVGFIIASAQSQSKLFTMKEAVQGAYGSLKPESYEFAQWKFGNQAITYVKSYTTLWERGLSSEEKQILSCFGNQ